MSDLQTLGQMTREQWERYVGPLSPEMARLADALGHSAQPVAAVKCAECGYHGRILFTRSASVLPCPVCETRIEEGQ